MTWLGIPPGTSSGKGGWNRFGQKTPEVRVVTYYGTDNPIDGVILDVLIRKHKSIKSDLGVTVAVPGSSEQIAEALFEGALFRDQVGTAQLSLDFIDNLDTEKQKLHAEWENARDREKASRSRLRPAFHQARGSRRGARKRARRHWSKRRRCQVLS